MHTTGGFALPPCAFAWIMIQSAFLYKILPFKLCGIHVTCCLQWCGASSGMTSVSGDAGLVHDGGIATSDVHGTGHQWDGSNAWPPIQAMLIEGLHTYGGAEGQQCAVVLAQSWLSSNYTGWLKYGKMVQPPWPSIGIVLIDKSKLGDSCGIPFFQQILVDVRRTPGLYLLAAARRG